MRKYLLFFCFVSAFCNAQNQYPFFPKDQHCYLGSFPAFYKDFHQILNENKLKPCENKKEFFTASVLIKTDNTAEILENKTSQENKCSFELSKEVMKHMDKWIPAMEYKTSDVVKTSRLRCIEKLRQLYLNKKD